MMAKSLDSLEKTLDRGLGVAEVLFQHVATAILAIMLFINSVNIFLRTAIDFSFAWVWPWTMVLFVWFSFLSLYLLYRQRRDVSISVMIDRLGAGGRLVLGLIIHTIVLSSAVVLVLTIPELIEKRKGYIEIVGLPRYVLTLPFLASSVLVIFDALHNILALLIGKKTFIAYGAIGSDL